MGIFSKPKQKPSFEAKKVAILPCITGIKNEKSANFKTKKRQRRRFLQCTFINK